MRKILVLALLFSQFAASPLRADEETRQRLVRFFGGWYSWYPNTIIQVKESREVENQLVTPIQPSLAKKTVNE